MVRCSSPRPEHAEHVRLVGVLDAQRDVALQLAVQALADLPAGDELAFAAGERRGVDLEIHRQRRLIDADRRQAFRRARGSQIVRPMLTSSMPVIATMSPARGLLHRRALAGR